MIAWIERELHRAAETPEHQHDMGILTEWWEDEGVVAEARERIQKRHQAACERAGALYQAALDAWRARHA